MKELLIAFVLAQGADLATTHVGIVRGCIEMNPLYSGATIPVIYALKGSSVVFVGTIAWGMRKKRPGVAKALLWTGLIAGAGAAAWNITQIPHC